MSRARWLALAWLVAAAAIFTAYAIWTDPLRHAILNLRPFGVAVLVLAAATGFGWAARAPDLLTSAAVGLGVLAAIGFVAGIAHLLYAPLFAAVVIVGVLLFTAALLRERPWRSITFERSSWAFFGWAILVVITVAMIPFVAAPEISTDALEYHLLIPRLYVERNAIAYLPLFVESNYPTLAEYVYLTTLAIGDDIVAKSLHFFCGLLLLGAIARLTKQINGSGVLAAALFFSMPVVALTSGWAWNDMMFVLFIILCLSHLIDGRLVWAGVLFGLATWTKYTFVLYALPMAAVFARGIFQKWWRAPDAVRFAVPIAAIASLWIVKNAVLTGNPVYPFLNDVFQSPYWDATSDRYFHAQLRRYEMQEWHWWTYLTAPVLMTLKPRLADIHTGPLPLLLLPLAFVRAGDKATAVLRTFSVATLISWMLLQTVTRTLLSLLAVLCAMYAAAILRLPRLRVAIAVAIGVGVAMNITVLAVGTNVIADPVRYFIGLESRHEYISRMDSRQKAYFWMNANPTIRGVLLVSLDDPYYLRKPAIFSSFADEPTAQILVEQHGTSERIASALLQSGITHVAVRRAEYSRQNAEGLYSWSDAQRAVFRSFLAQCRTIAQIGDIVIYEIVR